METVLAIVALILCVIAFLFAMVAWKSLKQISRDLERLEKQLGSLGQKVAEQERTITALQSAPKPIGAEFIPLLGLLQGAKQRGAGATALLIAGNLLRTYLKSRKSRSQLPVKLEPKAIKPKS
jgi:hypothetical protein